MLTLIENLMLKFSQGVDHRVWAQLLFLAEPQAPMCAASWVSLWASPVSASKGHGPADLIQQPAPPLGLLVLPSILLLFQKPPPFPVIQSIPILFI